MKLFDYLIESYGYDEPILLEDLAKEVQFISYENLRKTMKRLTDENKIKRFNRGTYFIPKPNPIIQANSISINKVINKKYIIKGKIRVGYITGLAFANSLRLTTQNPGNIEIVTSETSSIKYNVENLKKITVTLRKPKVEINNDNYKFLQILDLLNTFDKYSEESLDEAKPKIVNYLGDSTLSKKELNSYLQKYSKQATLNLLESELYDEITRG